MVFLAGFMRLNISIILPKRGFLRLRVDMWGHDWLKLGLGRLYDAVTSLRRLH